MPDNSIKVLSEKSEWIAVDYFKLICVLLIVAIHLVPFASVNEDVSYYFNHVVCRIAVPFFFISSGFFAANKIGSKKAYTYIKRVLMLYLIYTLIYIPQQFNFDWPDEITSEYVIDKIRMFFFVGSYIQLWYLPALAFAVFMLVMLVCKMKLSDKTLAVLGVCLYCIGVLGNSYKEILFGSEIEPILLYYRIFLTTRNGLFFGVPFVIAGYLIRKNSWRIKNAGYFKYTVLFVICMFAEAVLRNRYFDGGEKDMMFFLLPAAVCFFLMICFIEQDKDKMSGVALACRNYSVTIFGLHLFVYVYLIVIMPEMGYMLYEHSILRYAVVVVITVIVSAAVINLSKYKPFRWLKYLY